MKLYRVISVSKGDSTGTSLLEMVVGISLIVLSMSLVGAGLFRALGAVTIWTGDVMATKDWRHADSLFAQDAFNAQSTSLADGAQSASSVTLQWTDKNSVAHTAIYGVSGTEMTRTVDGVQQVVARRVVSAGFSRTGRTLRFDLVVQSAHNNTENVSLDTYLRMLP